MDNDTKRELDIIWNQGIKVLRDDLKDVKSTIKGVSDGISSARRWMFGLILSLLPAYVGVIIAIVRK